MVSCRSCGRNITSGTLRCSRCGSPYHLSCSHRYKITYDGVFSFCCGINEPVYTSNFGYQNRNRNNKRRQNQNPYNSNNFASTSTPKETMRFAKIQKTEEMVVNDKPVIDINDDVIIEETLNINDNENQAQDLDTSEPEIILDASNDDIVIESHTQNVRQVSDDTSFNNKITLETVWQGISSLQSSISNISNSLDTVSTHLNTFDPRINELETTLNVIKNKTSNFDNVSEDVNGLKNQLERVTNEIENLKTQPDKSFDLSDVVSEIREREFKSKNLIIYNVPEDNLRISQDYSTVDDINQFNALLAARDTSRAREILANVPNVDLDEIETKRLGRPNPNVCRPLRVTLQSREDVIMVMRNRNAVSNAYNVKTDITKVQQKKIRELREELERINVDKDNPTMTIRFMNGEPKIMPIRRKFEN